MLDVTFKLEDVKFYPTSGITKIKLRGDDGFEWMVANHPDTPDGFISIGGVNNGSFRIIEKTMFLKILNSK